MHLIADKLGEKNQSADIKDIRSFKGTVSEGKKSLDKEPRKANYCD